MKKRISFIVSLVLISSVLWLSLAPVGASVQTVYLGDANFDGEINALDITAVERIIVGLDEPILVKIDDTPDYFTIVVMPDTQSYVRKANRYKVLDAQIDWIIDNQETENIAYTIQVGDLVDDAVDIAQWEQVNEAFSRLLDVTKNVSVLPGNHDVPDPYKEDGRANTNCDYSTYNQYFPASMFETKGGLFDNQSNEDNYALVDAGDTKLLILNIGWGHDEDDYAWANDLLDRHSDRLAIVATHAILRTDGTITHWNGDLDLWENVIALHDNIIMVTGGHYLGECHIVKDGINVLLANYQHYDWGGKGATRLYRFYPEQRLVKVFTYYTYYFHEFETDEDSQFEFNY